jgi:hypothetical protein
VFAAWDIQLAVSAIAPSAFDLVKRQAASARNAAQFDGFVRNDDEISKAADDYEGGHNREKYGKD